MKFIGTKKQRLLGSCLLISLLMDLPLLGYQYLSTIRIETLSNAHVHQHTWSLNPYNLWTCFSISSPHHILGCKLPATPPWRFANMGHLGGVVSHHWWWTSMGRSVGRQAFGSTSSSTWRDWRRTMARPISVISTSSWACVLSAWGPHWMLQDALRCFKMLQDAPRCFNYILAGAIRCKLC